MSNLGFEFSTTGEALQRIIDRLKKFGKFAVSSLLGIYIVDAKVIFELYINGGVVYNCYIPSAAVDIVVNIPDRIFVDFSTFCGAIKTYQKVEINCSIREDYLVISQQNKNVKMKIFTGGILRPVDLSGHELKMNASFLNGVARCFPILKAASGLRLQYEGLLFSFEEDRAYLFAYGAYIISLFDFKFTSQFRGQFVIGVDYLKLLLDLFARTKVLTLYYSESNSTIIVQDDDQVFVIGLMENKFPKEFKKPFENLDVSNEITIEKREFNRAFNTVCSILVGSKQSVVTLKIGRSRCIFYTKDKLIDSESSDEVVFAKTDIVPAILNLDKDKLNLVLNQTTEIFNLGYINTDSEAPIMFIRDNNFISILQLMVDQIRVK